MSYTPDAVQVAARAWIVGCIGAATLAPERIIYEHQDGPRPAPPFASLLTLDDAEVGRASTELLDVAAGVDAGGFPLFEEVAEQNSIMVVRLTCYGATAAQIAARIKRRWQLPSEVERAVALGLAIVTVGTPRRVPAFLSQVTEDRWVLELRVAHVTREVASTAAVESVTVGFSEV